MQFENQNLFENSLKEGVHLFLGAGFSVLAKNKDNPTARICNPCPQYKSILI